ncbi:hypothetical protein F5I97DRAFT_1028978 [Phlebopus sp. FC_14]|nr:hypothetical protein F5I97DRAFT_1028978 [Phlebopus sp. FC_14]
MAHQRSGRPRTASRSPVPLRTPTTPTDHFLPPSHYAAAAGVPYPLNRKQTTNVKVEPTNDLHLTPSQHSSRYLDSENCSQSGTSSRGKRKSGVDGLGHMETHLLPSLRDTVDRMTRTPSQLLESSPQPDYVCGVARTPSFSSPGSGISSRSDPRKNNVIPSPGPALKHPAFHSPSTLPTRSMARSKPKSILKSHGSSDRQQAHQAEHDITPTNRTRKAVRTPQQTTSGGGQSEQVYDAPTPQLPKAKAEHATRTGRTRSRTDPGTFPQGLSPSRGASIHQPSHQRSHIPRRVGMPPSPAPSRQYNGARVSDSGSEVEPLDSIHYENKKLFITNAELVSSSSSEREQPRSAFGKSRIPSKRDYGQTTTAQSTPPRYGLGVGLTGSLQKSIVDTSTQPWSGRSSIAETSRSRSSRAYDVYSSDGSCDVGDVGLSHYNETLSRNQRPHFNENVHQDRQSKQPEDHSSVCSNEQYHIPVSEYSGNDGPAVSGSSSEEFDGRYCGSEDSRVTSQADYSDSGSEYSFKDEEVIRYPPGQSHIAPGKRQSCAAEVRDRGAKGVSITNQNTPKASSFVRHNRGYQQLYSRDPSVSGDFTDLEASNQSEDENVRQREPTEEISQRYSFELSRIMAMSNAAAARQREAFGISPGSEVSNSGVSGLPHADSDLSSVGGDGWQDPCEVATDSLLQQMTRTSRQDSTDRQRSANEPPTHHMRSESSISQDSTYPTQESRISMSASTADPLSPTSSADHRRRWSNLERRVSDFHGEVECRRQRFVWELAESEEQFVWQLRNMIQLFILPLRVKDTRTWVSGVPGDVCKLFDWLEDIVRVHAQLSSSLCARQDADHGRLQSISEVFQAFIPKLETYQPFLVKLEFVAALIDSLVNEGKDDFGVFIKLQEKSDQCEGWSLEKYLIEPVNRLAQYPELFRRLLALTPKSHPDYFSTLSLFHSAKMTIRVLFRVLSEVKDREDEYELMKEACSRVQGIPSHLVKRERRLLMRGSLACTEIDADANGSSSDALPKVDDTSHLPLETLPSDRPRRSDKLCKAIKGRSASVRSTSTLTSCNSFCTAPSSFDIRSGQHGTVHGTPVVRVESEPEDVDVFVFTDLLLLASPLNVSDQSSEASALKVRDGFGLSRVISVTDEIDRRQSITVDLVPSTAEELDQGRLHPGGPVVTISFSYRPSRASVAEASAGRVLLSEWLPPLRKCCQHTLKSISSLTTKGFAFHDATSDPDAQNPVLSILASGLPFPKSPSMQIEASEKGEASNSEQQEREERGWWSKRFHEVFIEMSKQDIHV